MAADEERWAHLAWRTDFAEPSRMPDPAREPLFAFPANMDVNRALIEDIDSYDATRDLHAEVGRVDAPAPFIHGAADPRPAPVNVVGVMMNAELVTIPDAGHLPWLERPREVEAALKPSIGTWIAG